MTQFFFRNHSTGVTFPDISSFGSGRDRNLRRPYSLVSLRDTYFYDEYEFVLESTAAKEAAMNEKAIIGTK